MAFTNKPKLIQRPWGEPPVSEDPEQSPAIGDNNSELWKTYFIQKIGPLTGLGDWTPLWS